MTGGASRIAARGGFEATGSGFATMPETRGKPLD